MTPPLDALGPTGAPEPLAGGHRNTVLRVGALRNAGKSPAAGRSSLIAPALAHDVLR
ncbi:MAG: hypothetical protein AAF227_12755 [Pseudomonadota bacterium]